MMRTKYLFLALLTIMINGATAQSKKQFTLEDLIPGGMNYGNLVPKSLYAKWYGDRLVEIDAETCYYVSNKKGNKQDREELFSLKTINNVLQTAGAHQIKSLYHISFPYSQQSIVKVNNGQSAFLIDWVKKDIAWKQKVVPSAKFQDWNSASRNKAYVYKNNLYVQTSEGKQLQISSDGSRELVYGQSVHRDEFGISKGTFWSPSGQLLAFYRMDQTMVKDYPQVDISTREATYCPDKYPMAGMTSHKVSVGIFNPSTQKTVYLKTADPTDRYFTNISWSPDEKTIFVIELPRTQDQAELIAYDAATGAKKGVIYTEKNKKYVHPMKPLVFLPWDASKFIYTSEKDGYTHLYLFDISGKELKQVTKGNFVVKNILGFNEKTKSVVLVSTEASPIQNNIYSVNIHSGKRMLLDDGTGVHRGSLSASGKFVYDNYSSPLVARSYNILETKKTKIHHIFTASEPWSEYNVPEITSGTIKAADNKTDLYYRLIKPTHFDSSKKYPTVVYVYGGPGIRNVEASRHFATRGWEIYMAQLGYVVFVLDNRGSSDRGFDFESCTFRHLGDEEMKDQIKGVNFLKSLSYVDENRIGVHGWSFGGFMTTNLMCSYPEIFKVGVAGGPVIDWKYYEVMYGERYMDTPQENPEGYKSCSLLNKAGNLRGRLQIIFGYNDPVCVPQHTLSFIRACEDKGTQPDLFTYPGDGHNMYGRDRIHLHQRITRYFEDHLK